MVCLGNICRSPLAQGIAEDYSKRNGLGWEVDSAGTSSWHIDELPDRRSIETARKRGIDITDQRARQIKSRDLENFDLILAMDSSNYQDIISLTENEHLKLKVKLILNYLDPGRNASVPDPYFDGGFDHVFNLIESAIARMAEIEK
ncbi:MAG: low molecular weight phosphotyrosine protein phosphatase [Saprospiraceae bacterium]|nr:low molecular weight phosphotyrosine protein phosphatase [Bacteroidia bacterium]MBT8230517.1 low molecular weight phosphotyrosine protein phosphatase [Bacteroidia bacterium]NNF21096.1 low molecular weight phosphotyrosine protein phosphatase [Saprospiraceae bacterium]NNK89906.1 low molecular weight phosphotyrosine protein phosphatase [Saprospiraceae bacterium]